MPLSMAGLYHSSNPQPVNTTFNSTIVAGTRTITPASGSAMAHILVGSVLICDTVASGVRENVVVTAITGTTFTAVFKNGHTSGQPIIKQATAESVASELSSNRAVLGTTSSTDCTQTGLNITKFPSPGTFRTESYVDVTGSGATLTVKLANTAIETNTGEPQ